MTRVYLDLMRVYLAQGSIWKKLFDGPNGMQLDNYKKNSDPDDEDFTTTVLYEIA